MTGEAKGTFPQTFVQISLVAKG